MQMSIRRTSFACAGMLVLAACAPVRESPPENWAKGQKECPAASDKSALAGAWLYEEQGYIYTLRLDKQGNGAYEWKDARFLTSCLDRQQWRGTWQQTDNDREGRFEIRLSKDMTMGEGRWWYTRVGRDNKPGEAGAEFQVKRIGALSQVSEPRPDFGDAKAQSR